MLSKFFKNNKRPLLAMFIIFIIYMVFVYLHKDIVEGIENMTTNSTCNKDECKKNCPEFDIKCLKDHADACGDCQFNVSELSDEINNKSFHNNMNIEQPHGGNIMNLEMTLAFTFFMNGTRKRKK